MTHLLSDPRVVEAVILAAANPAHDDGHTDTYYAGLLTAAVAALPRDELIEKAAHAIAGEAAIRCDVWHPVAAYRADAIAAFKAIGLIPEHITATEEPKP